MVQPLLFLPNPRPDSQQVANVYGINKETGSPFERLIDNCCLISKQVTSFLLTCPISLLFPGEWALVGEGGLWGCLKADESLSIRAVCDTGGLGSVMPRGEGRRLCEKKEKKEPYENTPSSVSP